MARVIKYFSFNKVNIHSTVVNLFTIYGAITFPTTFKHDEP